MSFNIGQYIDIGIKGKTLINKTDFQTMQIPTDYPYVENDAYTDFAIQLSGGFKVGTYYYLVIEIPRDTNPESRERLVTIQLQKDKSISSDNQIIEELIIPKPTRDKKSDIYSFIISPNQDGYDKLSFILSRDLTKQEINPLVKEEDFDTNIKSFLILSNFINSQSGGIVLEENQKITQLGIHSNPGTLMCINGESFRIGKNGVFEINNADIIGINFLNVLAANKEHQYMIDYRYE